MATKTKTWRKKMNNGKKPEVKKLDKSFADLKEIGAGKAPDDVMPFWRVVEPGSKLAKKLSCGDDFIQSMRAAENT